MKDHNFGLFSLVILAVLCNLAHSRTIVKRQIVADSSLDPSIQEIAIIEEEDDRGKREIKPEKFALKNALLGFVFNDTKAKPSLNVYASRTLTVKVTSTKRPTTTEDIVIFEKNQPVRLEVPGRLLNSGFSFITKTSTTAGDYVMNSAIRLQRLLEVFRPVIQFAFGAKGVVLEATDNTKPIFSDGSDNST